MRGVKQVGCSVEGCTGEHQARGLCDRHYRQSIRITAEQAQDLVFKHKDVFRKRLLANSSKEGCWIWLGSKKQGYGQMNIRGIPLHTHRISWIVHNGRIPAGMFVCHSCDNPQCANPAHLFLGTHNDNMSDMVSKGRQSKTPNHTSFKHGERHPRSKITEALVIEIRGSDLPYKVMAQKYGLSPQALCDIRKRRTWQHI